MNREPATQMPTEEEPAPLPATVRALGWTSFLTDFSSEAIYPLLPAFLIRELGGSAVSVGLVDGIANAVAAIVRLPSGMVSDRVGRRPLVLAGYGISALARPLMGLVASPVGAIVVRSVDRLGKGIRSAPRDALVADLVEPGIRGRAFGHIRAMDHAGAAFGPLVAMLFLLIFPGRERTLFLLAILPGRLADRWHPRTTLAAGWFVFAAAYGGLAAGTELWSGLFLMLLVGIAYGLAEPAERSLVARLAPEGRQGGAFGWYALVQGVMALPAGLLAGWLWQQGPHGPAWAMAATAVLSTLACGLLVAVGSRPLPR